MALRGVPLERRWSEGTRSEAQGLTMGWPSFWLLFLGQTRKSDSARRPKQEISPPLGTRPFPKNCNVPTQERGHDQLQKLLKSDCSLAGNSPVPFRRPNAGAVEGVSRMDAAKAVEGA